MSDFIQKLGIDWKLLASQIFNFLLVVLILRKFAYGPILKMLKTRREKIEEGLRRATEAETRLHEADGIVKEKIKEAESKAVSLLRETEARAKIIEGKLTEDARNKESQILKNAEISGENIKKEAVEAARQEAVQLVKEAIAKTAELDPSAIDEALIRQAIKAVKNQ